MIYDVVSKMWIKYNQKSNLTVLKATNESNFKSNMLLEFTCTDKSHKILCLF